MNTALKTLLKTARMALVPLLLAGLAVSVEAAASGALFYDEQTVTGSADNRFKAEGMAWGYFHTGPLAAPLALTPGNPVEIQLYDSDEAESLGRGDDELQIWRSDASLTAAAGESVRFEFFSVVPADVLRAATNDEWDQTIDIKARFLTAPNSFAGGWNASPWSSSARNFNNRAASFEGYPAADHVVKLYYVHPGLGFSGVTPAGRTIETHISDVNKNLWGTAGVGELMVDSGTNQEDWETGNGVTGGGRSMNGFILVHNTSDRHGLTVNLDFLKLMEDDSPNDFGNDDDLLGEAESSAPANFNLGPGGTLKWVVDIMPTWDAIDSARDFGNLDGDLEPYAEFSVNGDPFLPVAILPNNEMDSFQADLPPSTFTFAAANVPSQLPPPPSVTYQGNAGTYTVDQDVNITCTVTENGGGVVSHSCVDIVRPAWSFPAGSNSFSASAYDFYGQVGTGSVTFDVVVTPESLIAITQRFVDHHGIENSLVKKIEAAARARNDRAQDGACQAFINEVVAQTGKFVLEDTAEVLIYWGEQLKLR